jgi:hypothetical protein
LLFLKAEYIKHLYDKVVYLEKRLVRSIGNCKQIKEYMSKLEDTPLFTRNNTGLLQLENENAFIENRYGQLKEMNEKIQDLLKVSCLVDAYSYDLSSIFNLIKTNF